MTKRKPMAVGEKYFRLTVMADAPSKLSSKGFAIFCVKAKCDCGNITVVPEYKLRASQTKSCGCLQSQHAIKNLPKPKHRQSGGINKKASPEYRAWGGMKQRCSTIHPSIFKHYGARGITVCERWRDSFENFLADMGAHPGEGWSLDRIDANGNYEPSNCRWANFEVQARNKRNNKIVIINSIQMCVSQAVKILDTHESKIYRMARKLNITYQKAIDLLMLNPRPVNMRQFKEILNKEQKTTWSNKWE